MYALFMGLPSVSPTQLHELLGRGGVVVLDVNARARWLAERVPGAHHLARVDFVASDIPASTDTILVFYCSNYLCRKAPNAARRARQLGFTRAAVMSAGIGGWVSAGLPVEQGERSAS